MIILQMAPGRGPYSYNMRTKCATAVPVYQEHANRSLQKSWSEGFKSSITDERDLGGGGEARNVGTGHSSVNSECETDDGSCEDTEIGTGDNGSRNETGKAE
jgi:hypothetical protein